MATAADEEAPGREHDVGDMLALAQVRPCYAHASPYGAAPSYMPRCTWYMCTHGPIAVHVMGCCSCAGMPAVLCFTPLLWSRCAAGPCVAGALGTHALLSWRALPMQRALHALPTWRTLHALPVWRALHTLPTWCFC